MIEAILLMADGSDIEISLDTEARGSALEQECIQEAVEQGHYQPVALIWAKLGRRILVSAGDIA